MSLRRAKRRSNPGVQGRLPRPEKPGLAMTRGEKMSRFIRYAKVFGLYELIQPYLKYSLPVEEKLPADNVLVIAPHADDESIGCGGAVHRHVKNGGKAGVVFCTIDTLKRENESAEAMKVLGITEYENLGYKVESLRSAGELGTRLAGVIEEKKPEIIFLPYFLDNHEDHRAVNDALADTFKKKPVELMVYAYPVWFPLYPNVIIDISGEWETKKKAIGCYVSQLATRDYVKMAESLGVYWAAIKGRGIKVAETFFKASAKEYFSLVRKSTGA